MEAQRRMGKPVLPDYGEGCPYADPEIHRAFLDVLAARPDGEPVETPGPGDIVVLEYPYPGWCSHFGIVIGEDRFLHTREKTGALIERLSSIVWKKRIAGIYRPTATAERLLPAIYNPISAIRNPQSDIQIVRIRNPFDRADGRDILIEPFAEGITPAAIIENHLPAPYRPEHVAMVVNGAILTDRELSHPLTPGDSVAIVPRISGGGGDIFKTIAMVVITVAAVAVGQYWAAAMGLKGFAATVASAAMTAAISTIGMIMINGLFPAARPDVAQPQISNVSGGQLEGSPVHGWTGPRTSWTPGLAIPVLYGEQMLPGQAVNYYIETNNFTNYQTVKMLLAMCYGEVATPVANASDIKLDNDLSLDDLEVYSFDTTTGVTGQDTILGFEKLHDYRRVSIEIASRQVLLLHGDVSPIVDSSPVARTVTEVHPVSIDTTNKKFGAGSLSFNGTNYLTCADSDDFFFEKDFSIDVWFRYTGANNYYPVCGQGVALPRWSFFYHRTTGIFWFQIFNADGQLWGLNTANLALSASTWYHVEVNRNGQTWGLWVDGVRESRREENERQFPNVGAVLTVGGAYIAAAYVKLLGNLEELQIVKNIANHSIDFAVPTAAYDIDEGFSLSTRGEVDEMIVHVELPYGLYDMQADSTLNDKNCDFSIHYRPSGGSWTLRQATIGYTSGGTTVPTADETVTDAVSGATGTLDSWTVDSGSWAGGDAAGDLILKDVSGTFGATNQLDGSVTGNNMATSAAANTIIHGERVTENIRTPVRRQFPIEGLTRGAHDVRLNRITAEDTATTDMSRVFWTGLDEVLDEELKYPYTSLLGVHIQGSERLSGPTPDISAKWDRGTISVPNFNGVGTQSVASQNAAWAAYDVLTNTLYGPGIAATRFDQTDWEAWADWCAASVDGTARVYIGGLFDATMHVAVALEHLQQIGRATIVQVGQTIRVALEKPATAGQLFAAGNQPEDSFSLQFIDTDNRPDILEIGFFNKDTDYKRDKVKIFSSRYGSLTDPPKTEHLFLWGCTDEDVARRYGLLRMQMNDTLNRIASHEADVDAIGCQVGDVTRIQHASNTLTFGGRLAEHASGGAYTTITLDQEIELPTATFSGNCTIWIRKADDTILERTVTGPFDVPTEAVTVSASASGIAKNDVWAIGRATGEVMQYRVTGLDRTEESLFKLTALEYNEDVYYHSDYGGGATEI